MKASTMEERKKLVTAAVVEAIKYTDAFEDGHLLGTAEAYMKRKEVQEDEKQAANM